LLGGWALGVRSINGGGETGFASAFALSTVGLTDLPLDFLLAFLIDFFVDDFLLDRAVAAMDAFFEAAFLTERLAVFFDALEVAVVDFFFLLFLAMA
jgi:hypothetical protein